MRVLGIDPGSAATGFGVVERRGGAVSYVAHGTLRTRAGAPLAERLAAIHRGLSEAIAIHAPERAVVERVFVAANPRSALVLGHARGVALAVLGEAGIPVDELAPGEIKRAVVGTGRAAKVQVQAMVTRLLALDREPGPDAADALAAAICRAQMGPIADLDPGRVRGRRRRRAAPRTLPGAIP